MLQILFMILKILGILLLVVFGIILLILLLVLFVPVRYRLDAVFDGKPKGGLMVSWLLHLLTVRVDYDENVKARVKILWFRLFDKAVWPAEEPEKPDAAANADFTESDKTEEVTVAADPIKTEKVVVAAKPAETVKTEQPEEPEQTVKTTGTEATETSDDTVQGSKIELLIEKITVGIHALVTKISCMYRQVRGKAEAGQEKAEQFHTFLADQENRNTIRLIWKQVKKLVCHILPRKISGRVRFGFDDPATTGQILTYVSPFYGMYAKTLDLEPVFDEKVMEGELHVKGHIRAASLLWIVIRVFLNKNFRKLLKQVMAIGKK